MRKYCLLLALSICVACNTTTQPADDINHEEQDALSGIKFSRSSVDFSLLLRDRDSLSYRLLSFSRRPDSITYRHMKYYCNCGDSVLLSEEIKTIARLWDIASDSIEIQLTSINIGYPPTYRDLLQKHIRAFTESENWNAFVTRNGKSLDYPLIKQVMLEKGVYDVLNPLLKSKGYKLDHFSTEKHGFVTEEILTANGFSSDEIIPMPYIVFLMVKPI